MGRFVISPVGHRHEFWPGIELANFIGANYLVFGREKYFRVSPYLPRLCGRSRIIKGEVGMTLHGQTKYVTRKEILGVLRTKVGVGLAKNLYPNHM